MKLVAIALFSAGCTIGPRLVSVPMGEPLHAAPIEADPTNEDPTEVEDAQPEDFSGSWSGTAWHVGNKTWPMTVTFEKHGRDLVGHVFYTDRRCRADWALHGAAKHWEGSETVKIDPFNGCPNSAQISVDVVEEDIIRFRWNGAGGIASATLQRSH